MHTHHCGRSTPLLPLESPWLSLPLLLLMQSRREGRDSVLQDHVGRVCGVRERGGSGQATAGRVGRGGRTGKERETLKKASEGSGAAENVSSSHALRILNNDAYLTVWSPWTVVEEDVTSWGGFGPASGDTNFPPGPRASTLLAPSPLVLALDTAAPPPDEGFLWGGETNLPCSPRARTLLVPPPPLPPWPAVSVVAFFFL